MKSTIKKSDFEFKFSNYGHYIVTYKSSKTLKSWTTVISNMPLIDSTKNTDYPKKVNLNHLKKLCKIN